MLEKPEATDALTAIAERYDELGLAENSNGIIEPGYYWIDGKIKYYGINQNLELDLQNNDHDRQAALDCINALEELQIRSKKTSRIPHRSQMGNSSAILIYHQDSDLWSRGLASVAVPL